ncbi:similar to Saccharomyces cerevisiae YKL138C MRPL31 Mitochondrial ribosomal protein of the large subunit [Geotrichum candidum]|uniref:Large ribosomal subunit protein mL60 n=2 Tax=Geotrichum candidum TaxID=1173061 RepID=A0A0J9XDX1_GEOCN|nr:similar to Saccharomyces cerevisiae YKL138C MRPL31 Mitochondrial ribosomal protein of the large subunit [Geotrichum candidum]
MFGPFRASMPALGGLLWKNPHTMSRFQKARHRDRLRTVDSVITTLKAGLDSVQQNCYVLEKVIARTPKESEMTPKDKYWIFDKKAKGYRKSAHRQPKWTKLTNRVPPAHF